VYKKSIIHVISVSFSIPIFFNRQFNNISPDLNFYVCCSPSDELNKYAESYNFIAEPININRKISLFDDLIAIIKLMRFINTTGASVVIGHTPKAAFLSMIAGFFSCVPHRIYFKHGLVYENSRGLVKVLLYLIDYFTEMLSTEIIAVSQSVKKESSNKFLVDNSKYRIIGNGSCNGIDVWNRFNPNNINYTEKEKLRESLNILGSEIVIGFIGRIANDKGVEELIQAWEILAEVNKNIKLLIIGPIDERDPISPELLYDAKSLSSLILVGQINNPEIYYSIMDIFILPSYREGLPTVNLEASSMSIPVITTRKTGCIDSIIENETGIFTEINALSISKAIEYYLANPFIRIEHGRKGREFVTKNFDQNLFWKELSNFYEEKITC
jgi:glycosyltransferase involved in cell wall biosynthesis